MSLPPAVAAVRRPVRRALAEVEPGAPVLVACSGGPDSMALLAATVFEGHKAGLRVIGAVVDHGLQPDSAEHTADVVGWMAQLGVDETLSARVQVHAEGLGPEAAARRARYAVLDQMAERIGAPVVLLGHTRDDQAETVLLGLARGSGARAIAGMRRSFGRYRRPLLDVPRSDTVAACDAQQLPTWADPHNDDSGFARVRVRRLVLPVLEQQLGPGVADALARTADQLRADVELLDDLADAAYARLVERDREGVALSAAELEQQPAAVRRRVLRLAALEVGAPASELFHRHVLDVESLVTQWRGQQRIDLPGRVCARRVSGRVRLDRPAVRS